VAQCYLLLSRGGLLFCGLIFLVFIGLRTFLEYPIWSLILLAFFICFFAMVGFVLLFQTRPQAETPFSDRLVLYGLITGFIALALLGVTRGFLPASVGASLEAITRIESWTSLLGVVFFVLLGVGIEIIFGLALAFGWSTLNKAKSEKDAFRERDNAEELLRHIERQIAAARSNSPQDQP